MSRRLERRKEVWKEGNVNALLSECVAIEKRMKTSDSNNRKPEYISEAFVHFIKTGNINRALRLLSENPDNGVLNLFDNVRQHESLEAFLASQLIPLNKSTAVRSIRIAEILRRIIGKAVMSVVKKEVIQAAVSLQVCSGQVAGVESAIHSKVDLFKSDNSAAVLQIDATNAFNSLNRNVFLRNIKVICPEISNFVINRYTLPSRLFC